MRRFRPRTPFPFHPSASLIGHLLHRFSHRNVPSFPDGSLQRLASATRTDCTKNSRADSCREFRSTRRGKLPPHDNVGDCAGSLEKGKRSRNQTAGFTPPRGTPNQFWAGLLACHHPSPAPSRENYIAQWLVAGIVRLTAAGGCAGMSAKQSHRLPVSPAPRTWSKAPKTGRIIDHKNHNVKMVA